MTIAEMQARAVGVAAKYKLRTTESGYRGWGASAYMAGFVADVGELSELVMVKMGFRKGQNVDEKLAHELSDCLFSVAVLAHELGVDLEVEFEKTMKELDRRLA